MVDWIGPSCRSLCEELFQYLWQFGGCWKKFLQPLSSDGCSSSTWLEQDRKPLCCWTASSLEKSPFLSHIRCHQFFSELKEMFPCLLLARDRITTFENKVCCTSFSLLRKWESLSADTRTRHRPGVLQGCFVLCVSSVARKTAEWKTVPAIQDTFVWWNSAVVGLDHLDCRCVEVLTPFMKCAGNRRVLHSDMCPSYSRALTVSLSPRMLCS